MNTFMHLVTKTKNEMVIPVLLLKKTRLLGNRYAVVVAIILIGNVRNGSSGSSGSSSGWSRELQKIHETSNEVVT